MLGLSLSCGCVLSPRLSHTQKLLLRTGLALRLKLQEPSFPNPLRGMLGIRTADSLLTRAGAVGLLVGGLAEAVWNRRRTEAELDAHKDVDVLVISTSEPIGDFEGGIDWWMPKDIRLDPIKTDTASVRNVTGRFWINGSGCVLHYRIKSTASLAPGLYFPSPELAVEIRVSEIIAMIDDTKVGVDDDVDVFTEKLRTKLGIRSRLPPYISIAMGRDPVPSARIFPFRAEPIPLEERRALRGDLT